MEVIPLRKIGEKEFRKTNIAELYHSGVKISFREWLRTPRQFKLASRSCDGVFHIISSDVSEVIAKHAEDIANGRTREAISELSPSDPMHGDRFVVFEQNPSGKAFLLGTVENAILLLAGRN